MHINKRYLLFAAVLFLTEVCIARDVHDGFIRPFFGDLLAVILLYCAVRTVSTLPVFKATLLVLTVAYLIELSQYFHLAKLLGLEHSRLAALLIGSYFSFTDLLMYTAGALIIILIESTAQKLNHHETAIK